MCSERIAGFARPTWALDVEIVSADQPVRTHEKIPELECKSSSELAIDLETGLVGVGKLAVMAVNSPGANAARASSVEAGASENRWRIGIGISVQYAQADKRRDGYAV